MPFNVRSIELESNKIFWQRLPASHLLEDGASENFEWGGGDGEAALPYKEDGVLVVFVGKI